MKIITFQFRLPLNPILLELQVYCKKLILSVDENGIADLYDFKRTMQHQQSLISLNYFVVIPDDIHYQLRSSLTCERLNIICNGETFISVTSRKKEFELAFKDLDSSRYN